MYQEPPMRKDRERQRSATFHRRDEVVRQLGRPDKHRDIIGAGIQGSETEFEALDGGCTTPSFRIIIIIIIATCTIFIQRFQTIELKLGIFGHWGPVRLPPAYGPSTSWTKHRLHFSAADIIQRVVRAQQDLRCPAQREGGQHMVQRRGRSFGGIGQSEDGKCGETDEREQGVTVGWVDPGQGWQSQSHGPSPVQRGGVPESRFPVGRRYSCQVCRSEAEDGLHQEVVVECCPWDNLLPDQLHLSFVGYRK